MRLDIKNKSFGADVVLENVLLEIPAGQTVALTGPSGIGKSTMMRIVAGLDTEFTGRAEGAGRIGIVFQEPTLLPWRSVLENITLTTGCDAARVSALLERVGLQDKVASFPNELSLGQQRRVALARALSARPDTLILDEAFASLDKETAGRMRELTRGIIRDGGFRTILVTHDLEEAVDLADRVVVLGGSPARLRPDYQLGDAPRNTQAEAHLRALRSQLGEGSPIPGSN